MMLQKKSRLPSEYKEVEYLESTGTQWIDIGYLMTSQKERIVLDYAHYVGSSLCGMHDTTVSPTQWSITIHGIDPDMYFYVGNSSKFLIISNAKGDGKRHLIDCEADNGKFKAIFDNTLYQENYIGKLSTTKSNYLFAQQNALTGKFSTASKMRAYSFQMWDNDVLVRDFIPCYRKLDNKPGMYDLVNNDFYTNQGTGEFLKGADV